MAQDEAKKAAQKEIIDWLEDRYMGEGRPDRDTPEAKAILTVVTDLGKHFRGEA